MFIVIGVLLIIFGMIMIWFNIPYSPIKSNFQKDINSIISENSRQTDEGVFLEKDFSGLPDAIQKYIKDCGYIGTPKMSYLKMEYHNVNFKTGQERS